MEQQTGQTKDKVVGAALAVILLILFAFDILGTLVWYVDFFLCNFLPIISCAITLRSDWVGFFWPAYQSFLALEQGGDVDQW